MALNYFGIRAIYLFELARTRRTIMQSIIAPVISTSLYFIVFGSAIGSRITQMEGISYGAFIVPGLIMLSLLTQSISNASFGIYFPKFSGTSVYQRCLCFYGSQWIEFVGRRNRFDPDVVGRPERYLRRIILSQREFNSTMP